MLSIPHRIFMDMNNVMMGFSCLWVVIWEDTDAWQMSLWRSCAWIMWGSVCLLGFELLEGCDAIVYEYLGIWVFLCLFGRIHYQGFEYTGRSLPCLAQRLMKKGNGFYKNEICGQKFSLLIWRNGVGNALPPLLSELKNLCSTIPSIACHNEGNLLNLFRDFLCHSFTAMAYYMIVQRKARYFCLSCVQVDVPLRGSGDRSFDPSCTWNQLLEGHLLTDPIPPPPWLNKQRRE